MAELAPSQLITDMKIAIDDPATPDVQAPASCVAVCYESSTRSMEPGQSDKPAECSAVFCS